MDRRRPVPQEVQVGDVGWSEWRSCRSKLRLCTRKEARKVRRCVQRRHRVKYLIYKCPRCGGYHLTKQDRHGPAEELWDGGDGAG